MKKRELLRQLINYFEKNMPFPHTELKHNNEYELAVAVILSAQCTDKRVNMITPNFFQQFPDFNTLANAQVSQIYEIIKSCSYPNNKARLLLSMGKKVVEQHNGTLPRNHKELMSLPGIGRKSANVLLSILEQMPLLAVDTHVFRVSHRLGLIQKKTRTALAAEKQITKLTETLDKNQYLHKLHHWLILHGRYICKARNPQCFRCSFTQLCRYYRSKNKKS